MINLRANLNLLKERINSVCNELPRSNHNVRIIAVSKTHSVEKVQELCQLGQLWFGENYAEELLVKARSLSNLDIRWTFIGTLQSNKIKKILTCVSEIQTVTNLKHAEMIARYLEKDRTQPFPIFIAVNLGSEPQKPGIQLKEVAELDAKIRKNCPELEIRGLMSVPPISLNDNNYSIKDPPDLFKDIAKATQDHGYPDLSLGMTHDMAIALAVGSRTLRIGTALFGNRPKV